MDYKIVTDGSCDLPPELCREKQVDVVPFYAVSYTHLRAHETGT